MGFFTGEQISPVTAPPMWPGMAENFGNAVAWSTFGVDPNNPGAVSLNGADPFLADRPGVDGIRSSMSVPTPRTSQTASQAWAPWDAGLSYLASDLSRRALDSPNLSPQMRSYGANVMQSGGNGVPGQYMNNTAQGLGGLPTQYMNNLMQYGSATSGSPGGDAMRLMLQYGAPSQAGQGVSNMMQFGAASPNSLPAQGLYSAQQYGAPSQAGQFMSNMAQWGMSNPNSLPGSAMNAAITYGGPSQASQPLSQMAQYGSTGPAGQILSNRAYGQNTPALSYLLPFMQAGGGQNFGTPPSMPTRQLYRNNGGGPVRIAPPVGYNLPSPY